VIRRPDHSIIIPFHSNDRLLRLCLATLRQTVTDEVEKILVMNNHRSEELPQLDGLSHFRIVRYDKSLGYSGAINEGAALASGKTLVFCDADTFYAGDWFSKLTHFHQQTENIGLASSRLLDPRTLRVLDFGIAFTTFNAPHPQRDVRPYHDFVCRPRVVQAACSASMIIDAKVFERVGGLDVDLGFGYSDLDLCLRISATGRQCWVTSGSTVFHRGDSASTNREIYKADVKARFAAKNSHLIQHDMARYFEESLKHFQKTREFSSAYLLVDLSTVLDREWHYDLLKEFVRILSIYDYSPGARDLASLSLIDHVGLNVLQANTSILYLVDRLISLKDNQMWFKMRPYQDDLVVDRNANISLLSEVINNVS
jgi:GT2 family glycosyltransferase